MDTKSHTHTQKKSILLQSSGKDLWEVSFILRGPILKMCFTHCAFVTAQIAQKTIYHKFYFNTLRFESFVVPSSICLFFQIHTLHYSTYSFPVLIHSICKFPDSLCQHLFYKLDLSHCVPPGYDSICQRLYCMSL